jgi:hypothetical protein
MKRFPRLYWDGGGWRAEGDELCYSRVELGCGAEDVDVG